MQRFHEMPFGAVLRPNGVDFRLWAPSLASARLWTPQGEFEMKAEGEWHRLFLEGAKAELDRLLAASGWVEPAAKKPAATKAGTAVPRGGSSPGSAEKV